MLICHKYLDRNRWAIPLQESGWTVEDLPIIARAYKAININPSNNYVKDAHSYWLVAYKGVKACNPNAKAQNVWPPGLEYTNALQYAPTTKWLGEGEQGRRFRPPQKSEDLMRKLFKLFIDISSNTYQDQRVVYDFFMGTGTTGAIATEFYCYFVGNDFDEKAFEVSKKRLISKF